MAATESRSASELVSLLLELARVVKARRYFEPGDARLRPLFEHARRVWAADLARHGALEIAIATDRIELGEQSVAIDGRLEATLDEWRARGVGHLRVDADADADALAGLVEVLAMPEPAVWGKGGAGPALARQVPVGIEIQPSEEARDPESDEDPGDTDVLALREAAATQAPEPPSSSSPAAQPRLSKLAEIPPIREVDPGLGETQPVEPVRPPFDPGSEVAAATAAAGSLGGGQTANQDVSSSDPPQPVLEEPTIDADLTPQSEESSTPAGAKLDLEPTPFRAPALAELEAPTAPGDLGAEEEDEAATADLRSGLGDDTEGDASTADLDGPTTAQHKISRDEDPSETDGLEPPGTAEPPTEADRQEERAALHSVTIPDLPNSGTDSSESVDQALGQAAVAANGSTQPVDLGPAEVEAQPAELETPLSVRDRELDETQPAAKSPTKPIDETSQPWVHTDSPAEDPDEDTDVVGRQAGSISAADTANDLADEDEDTDVVGLKPVSPTVPESPPSPASESDPPSGLSDTGRLRWPKRMLKAAAARSKRLADRALGSDTAPGSNIDDATAPNLTFGGLRSGSDTEPLPDGDSRSGRRGIADEDTLPVTHSSGEEEDALLNPSDAAASLLRELENASDGPVYAELMDSLVRLVEAEGTSLGTAATLRILVALATESDAKRGEGERLAAETAIRRLTQGGIQDALLDQAADGGSYAEGAGRVLRKLGPDIVGPLIDDALTQPEPERFANLAEQFENLEPAHTTTPVLAALGRSERQEVLRAIRLAERHPSLEATGRMADLLRSDDEFIREGAARALARRASPEGGDDPQALRGLARGLLSSDSTLAVLCAECLSSTGSPRAVPPLAASLHAAVEARDLETATERIRALGELGRGEGASELGSLLLAKDWLGRKRLRDLKLAACQALARLPGDEAVGVLSQAAQLRDRQIREAAQNALDRRTAGRSEE